MQKISGGIFAVLVSGFWYCIYPYHVLNQEYFSLFLNTPEFFSGYALKPGGWSEYVGLFIIQYFRYAGIGILFQTFSFLAVFYFVSAFMLRYKVLEKWFALAWLPAFLLLALQTHYDFLFTHTLKVVLYFGLFHAYTFIKSPRIRLLSFSLGAPFLLLVCGASIFVWLYLTVIVYEICLRPSSGKLSLCSLITLAAIALLWPQVWRYIYLINQTRLYSLFPEVTAFNISCLPVLPFLCLPFLMLLSKGAERSNLKIRRPIRVSLNLLLLAGFIWGLKTKCYFPNVELQLRQEYAISQRNWDEALKVVRHYQGGRPAIVRFTNLALAQKGVLAEKIFEYPQIGINGLIPAQANDYYAYLYGYAIYAALGQTNEAFRHLFEAAVCKFSNTPARLYKHIAESLIQLEKYEAAKRYLYLLLHTQRYKAWARITLKGVPDKGYGKMHPSPVSEDHIMGINVIEDLKYMARHAPGNPKVRDYLLIGLLLEKRLPEFYQYFSGYYPPGQHRPIPKVYEEALTIVKEAQLDSAVFNKYPVSADCKNRFAAYQIAADKKTYWFYYQHYNPIPEN